MYLLEKLNVWLLKRSLTTTKRLFRWPKRTAMSIHGESGVTLRLYNNGYSYHDVIHGFVDSHVEAVGESCHNCNVFHFSLYYSEIVLPTYVIFSGKAPTHVCYHKPLKVFQLIKQVLSNKTESGLCPMLQLKRVWVLIVTGVTIVTLLKSSIKLIVFRSDQLYFIQATV